MYILLRVRFYRVAWSGVAAFVFQFLSLLIETYFPAVNLFACVSLRYPESPPHNDSPALSTILGDDLEKWLRDGADLFASPYLDSVCM